MNNYTKYYVRQLSDFKINLYYRFLRSIVLRSYYKKAKEVGLIK